MDNNRNGVELLILRGTKVPNWLRFQSKFVTIEKNERFQLLRIQGGEAFFLPGDTVGVRTPAMDKSSGYLVAFKSGRVLMIRDLKGDVIHWGRLTCKSCLTITGKTTRRQRPGKASDPPISTIKCTRCGEQWLDKKH